MKKIFGSTSGYIDFSVLGEKYVPSDITKTLGLIPTYTCDIGEHLRYGNKNAQLPAWELKTEEDEMIDIEVQIDKMIDILRPAKEKLIRLNVTNPEYSFSFCCVVFVKDNMLPGLSISSSNMRFLSDIKARLEFDIYI